MDWRKNGRKLRCHGFGFGVRFRFRFRFRQFARSASPFLSRVCPYSSSFTFALFSTKTLTYNDWSQHSRLESKFNQAICMSGHCCCSMLFNKVYSHNSLPLSLSLSLARNYTQSIAAELKVAPQIISYLQLHQTKQALELSLQGW